MSVKHVEVLVEEPSAEAALHVLLPAILGEISFAVHAHSSKSELLQRLPVRLRGYAARRLTDPWFRHHARVVVLVDRDADDCVELKAKLDQIASSAGLVTKSSKQRTPYAVVNRIAIEELEAWFFGDWAAVREAYPRVSSSVPSKERFRDPDAIKGGTWEALEHVLQEAGYFSTGLRKIEVARAVSRHMLPTRNTSPSFRRFIKEFAHLNPR